MRIVQLITRPQRRGAEIFAVQLAEGLRNLGHEVWVISILKGEDSLKFSGKMIQLGFEGFYRVDIKGFKKLAKELDRIQPDIVQANASDTLRYGVGVKYFVKRPFKLIYRNANTISSFIRNKGQFYFNRFLHSKVDGVISVSENSKKDYLKLFRPKSIEVIPIGIDPEEIESKLKQTKNQLNGEYLIFIGSFVPEKDPIALLNIFKLVLYGSPTLKLVYLGAGPQKVELEKKIKELDLSQSVILIPNLKNIFPILSKAKALVMPSKIEGLPGVILEAMYCKIPVIAYDVGGISEVLKSGETGELIEPEDSKSFEVAILKVLNASFIEIENITSSAKELIIKNYQMDQIVKKFELFHIQLIDQNSD